MAYARRVLFNAFARERRRRSNADLPVWIVGALAPSSGAGNPEERDLLDRALDDLPPTMRAVLVLRFYEDLSVERVAELLGCSGERHERALAAATAKTTIPTAFQASVAHSSAKP